MQTKILETVIALFLRMLTPEMLRVFADMVLGFIENTVAGTKTQADDRLLLPLARMIRVSFGIEE
jgi:hypothetical protein